MKPGSNPKIAILWLYILACLPNVGMTQTVAGKFDLPPTIKEALVSELRWIAQFQTTQQPIQDWRALELDAWAVGFPNMGHRGLVWVLRDKENNIRVFYDVFSLSNADGQYPAPKHAKQILSKKISEFNEMMSAKKLAIDEKIKDLYLTLVQRTIFTPYVRHYTMRPLALPSSISPAIDGGWKLRIHRGFKNANDGSSQPVFWLIVADKSGRIINWNPEAIDAID